MAIKKEDTSVKIEKNKVKELHSQFVNAAKQMNVHMGILYNTRINYIACKITEMDINEAIDEDLCALKKTLNIHDKIIKSNIFNPRRKAVLKGKGLHPESLYMLADSIRFYCDMVERQKSIKDEKTHIKDELDRLRRIKNSYKHGKYDDIKILIDEKINLCDTKLSSIEIKLNTWVNPYNPYLQTHYSPSKTRPKNIHYSFMLKYVFATVAATYQIFKISPNEENKNRLSEEKVIKIIADLSGEAGLGEIDTDAIRKELKKGVLTKQQEKDLRKGKVIHIPKRTDVDVINPKYGEIQNIANTLHNRLKKLDTKNGTISSRKKR